jgi:hypothetical protein
MPPGAWAPIVALSLLHTCARESESQTIRSHATHAHADSHIFTHSTPNTVMHTNIHTHIQQHMRTQTSTPIHPHNQYARTAHTQICCYVHICTQQHMHTHAGTHTQTSRHAWACRQLARPAFQPARHTDGQTCTQARRAHLANTVMSSSGFSVFWKRSVTDWQNCLQSFVRSWSGLEMRQSTLLIL